MEPKGDMKKLPGELPIYYGSQTGTASGFADNLAQGAIQYGIKPKVIDLANFDLNEFLKNELSVFIMATYGSGAPTTNATKFYKWLSSEGVGKNLFKGKQFAVFGCGDSGFRKFNKIAKDVTELLKTRGGEMICETGLGDAGNDIGGDFTEWKESFWSALHLSRSQKVYEEVIDVIYDPTQIQSTDFSTTEFELSAKQYLNASTFHNKSIGDIRILSMKELRGNTTEGSTLTIELDSKASGLTYTTGQILVIFPMNEESLVEKLAVSQGWELDKQFVLKYKDPVPYPFPGIVSVREALLRFCDLTGLLS